MKSLLASIDIIDFVVAHLQLHICDLEQPYGLKTLLVVMSTRARDCVRTRGPVRKNETAARPAAHDPHRLKKLYSHFIFFTSN